MAPPTRSANQDAIMQILMMEDREAERAERQANIAALQIAQNNQGHGNHEHPGSQLKNFQNTNPPMFSKTEEPLDADDWLQTMENNLEVAGVEAAEKLLFSTHCQDTRAWWTSARAMNAGQMMTWEYFKLKFSKYHVPQGLIKKMRDEFRELKQGRMSVVEYRVIRLKRRKGFTSSRAPNLGKSLPPFVCVPMSCISLQDSINPKSQSEDIVEEHPRQLAPSVGNLQAPDQSSADLIMSSTSSSTSSSAPPSPTLGGPVRFGSYEFTPHSDSSRSNFSDLQGNMEMTIGSVHYNVNAEGILQLLESPTSGSTSPSASSSLDLLAGLTESMSSPAPSTPRSASSMMVGSDEPTSSELTSYYCSNCDARHGLGSSNTPFICNAQYSSGEDSRQHRPESHPKNNTPSGLRRSRVLLFL
ncbi:hypothetical protein QYE76_041080 [Lolium multiflorum]|uniref:Retrotransposon gag domain-containing protein n=1 Tax=Lolium multiflorum TaxID=4521 RepID=A0AAD8TE59_LOLMU|nr:hypothetical protein QYE76_041080 [Lolium multiflorum]